MRKDMVFNMRLSETEEAKLREVSERHGLSMGAFVRMLVLREYERTCGPHPSGDPLGSTEKESEPATVVDPNQDWGA